MKNLNKIGIVIVILSSIILYIYKKIKLNKIDYDSLCPYKIEPEYKYLGI